MFCQFIVLSIFSVLFINCSPSEIKRPAHFGRDSLRKTNVNPHQNYELWGTRPDGCNKANDLLSMIIDEPQIAGTIKALKKNKSLTALVLDNNCFRVGSEILIQRKTGSIKTLGRGLIQQIEILPRTEMLEQLGRVTLTSQQTTLEVLRSSTKISATLVTFETLQVFKNSIYTALGERSENCPEHLYDWSKIYLDKDNYQKELQDINDGKVTTSLWNGARNCFRVGEIAKLRVRNNGKLGDLGHVTIVKIQDLHISNLSTELADKIQGSYSDILKGLNEKIDIDGGFLSLIHYELIPEK